MTLLLHRQEAFCIGNVNGNDACASIDGACNARSCAITLRCDRRILYVARPAPSGFAAFHDTVINMCHTHVLVIKDKHFQLKLGSEQ